MPHYTFKYERHASWFLRKATYANEMNLLSIALRLVFFIASSYTVILYVHSTSVLLLFALY